MTLDEYIKQAPHGESARRLRPARAGRALQVQLHEEQMTPFTSDTDPRILEILEHYGFFEQVLKLSEEGSELSAAGIRYHVHNCDLRNEGQWLAAFAEELADTSIVMEQLLQDEELAQLVREARERKLDRQIARIRVEKAQEEKTYREAQKALSAARSVAAEGISDASARIYEGAAR